VARYCREIGIKIPDELASTELIVHRAQCRSGHDLVIHAARLHGREAFEFAQGKCRLVADFVAEVRCNLFGG